MTQKDALRLAEFVKDHDKRFEAKAQTDDPETDTPQTDEAGGSHVLLTRASDGTFLEPITSAAEYQARLIAGNDPGPTVRAAWEKWRS
jgi:hypothetical protein